MSPKHQGTGSLRSQNDGRWKKTDLRLWSRQRPGSLFGDSFSHRRPGRKPLCEANLLHYWHFLCFFSINQHVWQIKTTFFLHFRIAICPVFYICNWQNTINPRFSVRPDKNKNVEGLLVFILKTQGNLGWQPYQISLHKTSELSRQDIGTLPHRSLMFLCFRNVHIPPPEKKFWFCVNLGDRHVLACSCMAHQSVW